MQRLYDLFQSEVDHYFCTQFRIDCQHNHQKFISQATSVKGRKNFSKLLSNPGVNPFKIMRAMTAAHLMILNSEKAFDMVEECLRNFQSKDEWINARVLEPYFRFLTKCCSNRERYMLVSLSSKQKVDVYDMLFYSINMLKQLFVVVTKMPFIGRYYQSSCPLVCNSFIETIAIQAQRLYACFKQCLTSILSDIQRYLGNPESQAIMRGVFEEDLPSINQDMKRLFLDKYFYPLGKGIGVKLFKPEDQGEECQHTINKIVSNHCETARKRERDQLENMLFPANQEVNIRYYEDTLTANPFSCTFQNSHANEEQVEEINQIVEQHYSAEDEPHTEPKEILPDTNTESQPKVTL